MKECLKDCLSCSASFSIPGEDIGKDYDELYCSNKQSIVDENDYCEEYV